jgi:hypothetical protein
MGLYVLPTSYRCASIVWMAFSVQELAAEVIRPSLGRVANGA